MFLTTIFENALLANNPKFLMRARDEGVVDITSVPVSVLSLNKYVNVSGLNLVPSEGVFGRKSLRFTGMTDQAYVTCVLPTSAKVATPTFVFVMTRIRNVPLTTGNPGHFSDALSCRQTASSSGFVCSLNTTGIMTFGIYINGVIYRLQFNNSEVSLNGSIVHLSFDGRFGSLLVDGVSKATFDVGTSANGLAYPPGDLKFLFGCATDPDGDPSIGGDENFADFDLGYFGIFSLLSSADIAAQVAAFKNAKKLAGTALLDDGSAASSVVISEWSGTRKASVVPAASGSWQATVPAGDYLVTALGPAGYRPISHGPVTAVDP